MPSHHWRFDADGRRHEAQRQGAAGPEGRPGRHSRAVSATAASRRGCRREAAPPRVPAERPRRRSIHAAGSRAWHLLAAWPARSPLAARRPAPTRVTPPPPGGAEPSGAGRRRRASARSAWAGTETTPCPAGCRGPSPLFFVGVAALVAGQWLLVRLRDLLVTDPHRPVRELRPGAGGEPPRGPGVAARRGHRLRVRGVRAGHAGLRGGAREARGRRDLPPGRQRPRLHPGRRELAQPDLRPQPLQRHAQQAAQQRERAGAGLPDQGRGQRRSG